MQIQETQDKDDKVCYYDSLVYVKTFTMSTTFDCRYISDRNSNLRTGKYAINGRNSNVLIQMRQEADEYQCLRSGFREPGTERPNIPSMLDRDVTQ